MVSLDNWDIGNNASTLSAFSRVRLAAQIAGNHFCGGARRPVTVLNTAKLTATVSRCTSRDAALSPADCRRGGTAVGAISDASNPFGPAVHAMQIVASHNGSAAHVQHFGVLLAANDLDCRVLEEWFRRGLPNCRFESTANLEVGLALCRRTIPRLAILDPAVCEGALVRAIAALREGAAQHLLVLDQRPLEMRLPELLPLASASYISRQADPQVLIAAMRDMIDNGQRAFDPALASRLRMTRRGYELHRIAGASPIANLSMRERQVLRLLAEGNSVRQCAETLGLSHSTIDNHKSRLMKKLGVHKTSALMLHAFKSGMLPV